MQKKVQEISPATHQGESTPSILFVDDFEMLLNCYSEILQMAGYQNLTARTAKEAIEVFREHHEHLELVVLDMSLPDMSGVKVLEAMCAIAPDVKVVISSGDLQARYPETIGHPSILTWMPKPISAVEFVQTIEDSLHAIRRHTAA